MAADRGSFRQSAIEFGVWESTVSRCIRDLEDEVGVALFIRSSAGVKLTDAGEKFLSRVRIAINLIEYAMKDAGAAGRGEIGRVRIGIISSLSASFVVDLLKLYQVENPLVQLDFIENCFSGHISAVQHCQMDVAFLAGNPAALNCDSVSLWKERLFIALPVQHILAARDEVTWKELRHEIFIVSYADPGPRFHDYIVRNLSDKGHHPSVERCNVSRDNLIKLVSFGQGLTLVNEASINTTSPGVAYRPIVGEILFFNAFWSTQNDNPAFRRFLSMAKSIAEKHSRSNS